jgi:hypothetical protein
MAEGGEGLEYITYLISNYSPKFTNGEVYQDINLNRWHTKEIWFYYILAQAMTPNPNVDHLVDYLHDAFIENNKINNQEDIDSCLKNAKLFHESLIKPPLLRTHYSNCDYFNTSNTWLLYLDDIKWFEYRWCLWYIKNWNNTILKKDFGRVIYSHKTYRVMENISTMSYDKLLELIESKNLEQLPEGYITFLKFVPSDYDLTDYLDNSLSDLFEKIKPTIPLQYENIKSKHSTANTLTKVNILNYSDIFTKGYLENIFEITSDEFHTNLIDWHEKNLSLMSSYGFDTTPYIV